MTKIVEVCSNVSTLRAVGFSHTKRERNHCKQPSTFLSSMRELVKLHVMHLMSISFVDQFAAGTVSVPKNANFSPKALTKERSKTSLNYGKYLVCGLNVEPIFKGFLLCLERDC